MPSDDLNEIFGLFARKVAKVAAAAAPVLDALANKATDLARQGLENLQGPDAQTQKPPEAAKPPEAPPATPPAAPPPIATKSIRKKAVKKDVPPNPV